MRMMTPQKKRRSMCGKSEVMPLSEFKLLHMCIELML